MSEQPNGTTQVETTAQRLYTAPRVDIYEEQDGYLLIADVPGVSKENLDIRLNDNELCIEGRRGAFDEDSALLTEFRPVDFRRTFTIDEKIDIDNISAELKDGVLHVKLPKSPELKVRQIAINA